MRNKTSAIKLPFGVDKTKRLVHISEVEGGKQCDCICPGCGSALIAAKGNIQQHHFKHTSAIECETGFESAIHLAAKQLIKEKKKISLPERLLIVTGADSRGIQRRASKVLVPANAGMDFDAVEDEVELNGMRVDLLATTEERPLIIEICYRHKVDEEKRAKIASANISAIEIDLSDLRAEHVSDWAAFWSLINAPERSSWLYNARERDAYEQLEQRLTETINGYEQSYEREDIAAQKQRQNEQDQLLRALAELKIVSSNETINQFAESAEEHRVWRHHRQYLPFSWKGLPDFVNRQVPNGDWIFCCDRRIWQIAVYSYFICKNGKLFSVRAVDNWLQWTVRCTSPRCASTVGIYGRRYPALLPDGLGDSLPSTWETLRAYCDALCELQMLSYSGPDRGHRGSSWYSVRRRTPRVPTTRVASSATGSASI